MAARLDQAGVHIRTMGGLDVADVVAIERESYAFPWAEGIFHDCLRVGYCCRVLECDGVVIGYAILACGVGEAHLLNLCVQSEWRGYGLGRMLLGEMLAQAETRAARHVFLEVRISNQLAIALYESVGFRRIGIRRRYYQAVGGREDALVLQLPLPAD